MMQDQQLLMLRWRSFSGGGSDIVAAILSHKGGQNFDNGLISSYSCLIISDTSTIIVDAPLRFIFKR